MKVSLICAVYNQARNLELILETVAQQTFRNFEFVVADDGSSDNTETIVEQFRKTTPDIPIKFVTQEDNGFQKTKILNKAIHLSNGDYLIFIDGDMLLEKHFVELHLKHKNPKHVLCGHRGVKLNPDYTQQIVDGTERFSSSLTNIIKRRFSKDAENPMRALRIENPLLRKLAVPAKDNLSGCNFSLYRDALFEVNGFNEGILEHGFNDYELGHRLKLAGYQLINVSKLCVTFHLYHPTRKTRRKEVAEKIAKVDASTSTRCEIGLIKPENT